MTNNNTNIVKLYNNNNKTNNVVFPGDFLSLYPGTVIKYNIPEIPDIVIEYEHKGKGKTYKVKVISQNKNSYMQLDNDKVLVGKQDNQDKKEFFNSVRDILDSL